MDDMEQFLSKTNPDLTAEEVSDYGHRSLVGAESVLLHFIKSMVTTAFNSLRKQASQEWLIWSTWESENNLFRAVNQFTVSTHQQWAKGELSPRRHSVCQRYALCVIELKNYDVNATIYDAWEQINIRYWRDIPQLLHYARWRISDGVKTRLGTVRTPMSISTHGVVSMMATRFPRCLLTSWDIKGRLCTHKILGDLQTTFTSRIANTTVTNEIVSLSAVLCCPPLKQSIIKSVVEKSGKGGTYFGATGCGKTYKWLSLHVSWRCAVPMCRDWLAHDCYDCWPWWAAEAGRKTVY